MAVYVDAIRTYAGRRFGSQWCHMTADSLPELHRMATRLRLQRRWFQAKATIPHYDLTPYKRALAVLHGAVEVSSKDLVRRQRKDIPPAKS